MKKFLVVALSALMLLALFIPAMAAPVYTTSVSAAKVKPGEEVTITVSVNEKVTAKGFALDYSAICGSGAQFELVSADFSSTIKSSSMLAVPQQGNGQAASAAMSPYEVSGEIFTLKVKAKTTAALGTYTFDITVKVDAVAASTQGASVEIYHDCVAAVDYSKDDTNHWKACALGCDKKIDEEPHNFGASQCGGTCTVCGYTRAVTHNFTKMNSDDTYHWYECAFGCGTIDESTKVAHAGGTATCVAKANCSTCNKAYGELGEHGSTDDVKVSDATCKDPASYKKVCSVCGEQVGANFPVGEADASKHTGGKATCKDKAICTYCSQPYGDLDPANHTGNNTVTPAVPATCTAKGKTEEVKCNDCGVITKASTETDMIAHAGGTATCKEAAKCSTCGQSYGEKNPNNHTGNNTVTPAVPATCTAEGKTEEVKCNDCGVITTASKPVAKIAHKAGADGKCEVCGETVKVTTTTTTRNPNVPQNGDSSNVVLFATLSIISILSLGAIVISKRARASK